MKISFFWVGDSFKFLFSWIMWSFAGWVNFDPNHCSKDKKGKLKFMKHFSLFSAICFTAIVVGFFWRGFEDVFLRKSLSVYLLVGMLFIFFAEKVFKQKFDPDFGSDQFFWLTWPVNSTFRIIKKEINEPLFYLPLLAFQVAIGVTLFLAMFFFYFMDSMIFLTACFIFYIVVGWFVKGLYPKTTHGH